MILEAAISPSKISALSSGEFVGLVADDPENKIELKTFHCEIINDHATLKSEEESYKEIAHICKIDNSMMQRNFIQDIIHAEISRLLNDPSKAHLVVKKIRKRSIVF